MTLSTSNNVVCPVVLTSAVSVARMILFHVPPRMYAGMGELGTESVATPLTKTTNLSLMESAFKHEALGQAGRLDNKDLEAYCTTGALCSPLLKPASRK